MKGIEMFVVGKKYEFITLEGTVDGVVPITQFWEVAEIDGPLLKLRVKAFSDKYLGDHPERTMILNTGSQYFVSATPDKT